MYQLNHSQDISKQQLFNVCHFILGLKKIVLCVKVLCFMGQFYVDNLRTLLVCQQFTKKALLLTAVIDRRPVDNSPKQKHHVCLANILYQ